MLGFDLTAFDSHNSASEFEAAFGEAHKYYVGMKIRLLHSELKQRLDLSRATILDVGCGTGLAEYFLSMTFQHLFGIDTSQSMLRMAKGRCANAGFVRGDGIKMPFHDNAFDVSFSFALMHHIRQDLRLQALTEIVRVTKPNGYVLTFEHNPNNPIVPWMVHKCGFDDGAELVHLAEMMSLYRKAGLHAVRARYLIFLPSWLRLLGRLESLFSWMPLGGQYLVVARK